MKSCLRVAIPEGWPVHQTEADWVLLGDNGQLQLQGRGPIPSWPVAEICQLLCLGAQVLWTTVDIPPAKGRDRERLWRYAIEEHLLDHEVPHLTTTHAVPLSAGRGEQVGVLVMAEQRLRQIVETVQASGRHVDWVCAEVQTAPSEQGVPHLTLAAQGAVWRATPAHGVALDTEALRDARAAGVGPMLPGRVHLDQLIDSPATVHAALADWPDWVVSEPYRWWQGDWSQACNLLHGQWVMTRRFGAPGVSWRWPVGVLLGSLLFWALVMVSEVGWWRYREHRLERQSADAFAHMLPSETPVWPQVQMGRALAVERARHGQLRADDALSLIGQLGEVLSTGSVTSVAYQQGVLNVQLVPEVSGEVSVWSSQLKDMGLQVDQTTEANTVRLTVRTREITP